MNEINTEAARIALALCVGVALGLVFFCGLFWTVRRCLKSRLAGLWFSASFLLRTAIVVTGFRLTARGDWRRMLACLVGFLGARLIVVRFTRLKEGA
jgi:F1F0 ATPase subunit 2